MKICLINNLYKPYSRGGAENIVEIIARGLKSAGHDVFLITTESRNSQLATRNSQQKIYYINSLYYNLNKIPKLLRLFWHLIDMFDLGSYFQVKKILQKEKPDIVMTHNLKGIGYLIPNIIKRLKIKHIHTLHDIQLLHPSGLMIHNKEKKINNLFSRVYIWFCCLLFNSPDVVISPSNWLMQMHESRGFFSKSKKVLLPNPAEVSDVILNNKKYKTSGAFRFFYAGQIEEHKGILFLINAFKKLKSNCELTIAGGGLKIDQAKMLAGKNRNIKIIGRVSKSEVSDIMQKSDALIMSSLCYENSPTVIYEALIVGLPVIASRIGGAEELIRNTAGILFEPGNEEYLINKMQWAEKNRGKLLKISQNGLEKIKQFSADNYISRLEKIARNLTKF